MDRLVVALIDAVTVPVTGTIPFLASSGILLAVFAALWVVFGLAVARDRAVLDRTWVRLRRWPLGLQALAWLLFLPVLVALWIWTRGWPLAGRLVLIGAIAGWNLLVFIPAA